MKREARAQLVGQPLGSGQEFGAAGTDPVGEHHPAPNAAVAPAVVGADRGFEIGERVLGRHHGGVADVRAIGDAPSDDHPGAAVLVRLDRGIDALRVAGVHHARRAVDEVLGQRRQGAHILLLVAHRLAERAAVADVRRTDHRVGKQAAHELGVQMVVGVDEAGGHDHAGGVDDSVGRDIGEVRRPPDGDDAIAADHDGRVPDDASSLVDRDGVPRVCDLGRGLGHVSVLFFEVVGYLSAASTVCRTVVVRWRTTAVGFGERRQLASASRLMSDRMSKSRSCGAARPCTRSRQWFDYDHVEY